MRAFVFSQPYCIDGIAGATLNSSTEPRFVNLTLLLFVMFDAPLWALIVCTAFVCALTLLIARVYTRLLYDFLKHFPEGHQLCDFVRRGGTIVSAR